MLWALLAGAQRNLKSRGFGLEKPKTRKVEQFAFRRFFLEKSKKKTKKSKSRKLFDFCVFDFAKKQSLEMEEPMSKNDFVGCGTSTFLRPTNRP